MLFKSIGAPELLIILAIVLLVFGVGRLSRLGKDLGQGIREFRKGISGGDDNKEKEGEKAAEKAQEGDTAKEG